MSPRIWDVPKKSVLAKEWNEKKFEGTLPHKKVMDGVEEDFSFIKQNLLEDQNGATENFGPSPQIQP